MISEILSLLFPPRCKICKHPDKNPICKKCLAGFSKFQNETSIKKGFAFDSIRSGGIYENSLKEAIRQLKYKNGKLLAPCLAGFMCESIADMEHAFDAVTYVPLTKRKESYRGYNQSQLLAVELSKLIKAPCINSLIRIRDNKEQNKSGLTARLNNIGGAFKPDKSAASRLVKTKRVLLVDDVFTTGSTTNECARVLKNAGISEVHVITLARPLYSNENHPKGSEKRGFRTSSRS